MKNSIEIYKIAESRLEEATVMCETGYYECSCYLALYSIELALKAKICILLDVPNLFENKNMLNELKSYKTHDFNNLFLLAGLNTKFQKAKSEKNNLTLS